LARPRAALLLVAACALVATALLPQPRALGADKEKPTAAAAIPVVIATVERRDVPVRLNANGSVVALQSVDLRAQITSTVRELHIREGQFVRAGELLLSLDSRAEDAALRKATAQVEKDRSDLAAANRNLERQRELLRQKFISPAAFDAVQNQVDTLNGQLAVDEAAVESARVARAYTEIRASFAGRTGAISVRPGSLVQPNAAPLVTVTQIDPIGVSFALPEKELPYLQRALGAGNLPVEATYEGGGATTRGKVTFIDNAVDTAAGTIKVKGEFANPGGRLWPGMFVKVVLAPRVLAGASVVPVQAVQTGPDGRFVYTVDDNHTVAVRTVTQSHVESGFAVIEGVSPGMRVVVEGAQNLRPGSVVAETSSGEKKSERRKP
jgi:RND family efflux transporter MFP subunit